MWASWLAHVVAALAAFLTEVLLIATTRDGVETLREMGRQFTEDPQQVIPILAAVIAVAELGLAGLAFVLTPWAAHDEPLVRTWRYTLRVVWWSTGCAVPCVLFPWVLRIGDPPFSDELLVILLMEFLAIWVLSVILRAAGIRRDGPKAERPPMCEICGYDLSHTPQDGRCPECGTAVVESFGPGLRRPTAWETSEQGHRLADFVTCTFEAALRPRRFFRTMLTRSALPRARKFLLLQMVVTAVAAWASLFGIVTWLSKPGLGGVDWEKFAVTAISGVLYAVMALLWVLFLAATTGLDCRRAWKQDIMPGVAKTFCYTAGMISLVTILCGMLLGPTLVLMEYVERTLGGGPPSSTTIFGGWLVLCGAGVLWHIAVSWLGVRRIRYANA